MGRVSGRACIVTGVAQGIGRAIAEALLEEGASVCLADVNGNKLADVVDLSRKTYGDGKVTDAQIKVSDCTALRAMIDHAVAIFGKLDVKFTPPQSLHGRALATRHLTAPPSLALSR